MMDLKSLFKIASSALLLLSCLIIAFDAPFAQLPVETAVDSLSRYDNYSRIYYQVESMKFSLELIPLEKYLTHLITGVNSELTLRKERPVSLDKGLSSQEISRKALEATASVKGNYFAQKFEIWKQFQLNEYYLQIDRILRYKKDLLNASSESEKRRMFNRDLESAMNAYSNNEPALAIKIFHHIIDFYKYRDLDDVYFFLAETYYRNEQNVSAMNYCRKILNDYPQSEYFEKALFRIFALNYRIANDAEVNELYPVFAQRESEWKYKKDAIYFAKGITEFQRNQFALAKDLFGKIEKSSAYYLKAQYLIGHCWCKENQYQKAVDIFNEILITNKQDDIWEESAIVAGDIKVTLADYNNAWGYYRLIKETSALFPRGLVGQAICHYMREEYAIADSLVDIVLTKFEGSQYSLMARCLKANILKKSGHIEPGSGQYDLVLHESGTKISLSESYIERLKTIYLLNELRVSEEEILDTGDENLFNRYWLLRLNLEKLLKRALYSEVLEVKPGFQEYIDEKLNVMKVVEEFIDLADSVANINNLDLTEYYAKVQDRMSELSKMIQGAGIGQLKKLPNYYTITDADFTKEALDSLYFATSGELDKLTQELNSTTFALETAEGSVGYEERAKMLETVDDIIQWRQMLDIRLSRDFTKMGRNDKLDFTRWSHIAFHKSMVPGSDFDDLKSNQKRIKAIDEYIQALGSIAYQFGVNVKEK